MSISDNIIQARDKLEKVHGHLVHVIDLHESNRIVGASDALAGQVPKSVAANAFNLFSDSFYRYQIVRTCALWDTASGDRDSIPSVVHLVRAPQVIDTLIEEIEKFWSTSPAHLLNPPTDPEIAKQVNEHRIATAKERAATVRNALEDAIMKADEVRSCPELDSLRKYRDRHLAHSLTVVEPVAASPARRARYGDEETILKASITVMDGLWLGLQNGSISWDLYHENARRMAEALWHHCTFDIKH